MGVLAMFSKGMERTAALKSAGIPDDERWGCDGLPLATRLLSRLCSAALSVLGFHDIAPEPSKAGPGPGCPTADWVDEGWGKGHYSVLRFAKNQHEN